MADALEALQKKSEKLHDEWMAEHEVYSKNFKLMSKANDRRSKSDVLSEAWDEAQADSWKYLRLIQAASKRREAIWKQEVKINKKIDLIFKKRQDKIWKTLDELVSKIEKGDANDQQN